MQQMSRIAVCFALVLILGTIGGRLISDFALLLTLGALIVIIGAFAYSKVSEKTEVRVLFFLICCLLFIYGALRTYYCFNIFNPDKNLDNKNIILRAFVSSFPENADNKVSFIVRSKINDRWYKVRVTCNKDIKIFYGDMVKISGKLKVPQGKTNRFGFDYKEYLKSKGVLYTIFAKELYIIYPAKGFLNMLNRFSYRLDYLISTSFDKELSSLIKGLILGNKSTIAEDIYKDFQRSGLAHLLAVSGGNVGVLCAFVEVLHRRILRFYNRGTNLLIILVIIIFAIITGLSSSVLRASIMAIIYYLGKVVYRNPDTLNSLGISALFMLIINPLYLFDIGFQLSFLSVLSILIFYKPIFNYLYEIKIPKNISSLVAVSIAAQILILPFLAYYFCEVSIISFLTNIIAVPLAGVLVPLGFAYYMPLLINFNIIPLKECIEVIVRVLIYISKFSHFKFSYVKIIFWDEKLMVAYYILILVIFYRKLIPRWAKKVSYLVVSILIVSFLIQLSVNYNRPYISIIDVGQGDSALLKYKGFSMLIDTGPVSDDFSALKRIVLPYLLKNNVSELDFLVLTHKHNDHIGDFDYLLNEIKVKYIITSNDVYKENFEKLKGKRVLIVDSLRGFSYKDLKVYFLPPIEEDENSSVVTKIVFGNFNMIFMGDASIESEDEYIKRFKLKSEILRVGHHGSSTATSEEFLDSVSPKVAIISVGKNNMFGHPSQEVIDRLRSRGIKIFRTDLNGTIDIFKIHDRFIIHPYLR